MVIPEYYYIICMTYRRFQMMLYRCDPEVIRISSGAQRSWSHHLRHLRCGRQTSQIGVRPPQIGLTPYIVIYSGTKKNKIK